MTYDSEDQELMDEFEAYLIEDLAEDSEEPATGE
jgi:hypothetical protein